MKYAILLLVLLSSIIAAQMLEQTDWSGGPGVTGPEWWFGDTFLESYGLDWSSSPGDLALQVCDLGSAPPLSEFPASNDAICSGSLTSSLGRIPMGTDWSIEWGDIWWTCYEPDTTDIYFQLRTGMSPGTMGAWGDPIYESGTSLDSLLPDDILLLQYRVTLETDDPYTLPILYDVTIEGWYPGGIEEEGNPLFSGSSLIIGSNPSYGSIEGSFTLAAYGAVQLTVYDTAGRSAASIMDGDLAPGSYSFNREIAASGLYLLVLETDGRRETQRIAILTQ